MSLTCHEEFGRVGRVGRACYEDPREDVGESGMSARMSRGCYEETVSVEFMLNTTCTDGKTIVMLVYTNKRRRLFPVYVLDTRANTDSQGLSCEKLVSSE